MRFLFIVLILLLCSNASTAGSGRLMQENARGVVGRTIIVDHKGRGHFTRVQSAIDSVPEKNNVWTRILVKAGTYDEKVTVPRDKRFIVLQGEGSESTVIQWGQAAGNPTEDVTFTLSAENFVAADIGFKNTYNLGGQNRNVSQAPAADLHSDKASFYNCRFSGVQDTLSDLQGRHYFKNCYIEGAVDFIWGNGQSIYEGCVIQVNTSRTRGGGYITAQGRENPHDGGGFVFLSCSVQGNGWVYLGRAYRQYARVIFKDTEMANIIKPEGWLAWTAAGREASTTFVEEGSKGPGGNKSKRVPWMKNLPRKELNLLTNIDTFINQDRWIEQQPKFHR